MQSDFFLETKIKEQKEDAIEKAWEALSGYKFIMFGYHASRWINYNRLCVSKDGSPFTELVDLARKKIDQMNQK